MRLLTREEHPSEQQQQLLQQQPQQLEEGQRQLSAQLQPLTQQQQQPLMQQQLQINDVHWLQDTSEQSNIFDNLDDVELCSTEELPEVFQM